ncbi:MAG: thioredoxin domain-containing protein [Elusimicrobia bacterium]|nr:thioredoxin domain-containing protein [Elusimicrobiota bacterium]
MDSKTARIAAAVLAALLPALSHAASAPSVIESTAPSAAAPAKSFDREGFYKHIRKVYGVPPNMRLSLGELKASAVPGLLAGRLEFGEGAQAQAQPVQITQDGRHYILGAPFKLGPSKVPGFRSPMPEREGFEAPALQVTKDGRFLLPGQFQDLSVDPDAANRAKIQLKGAVGWGPADAKVVIVEYSDFQCPHCKKAFEAIENDLLPKYPGKLRLIFKDYPLTNIHPWAFDAAIAAACARSHGAEVARKLHASMFAEQASLKKEEFRAKVLEFAKGAGADPAAFERCFDKQESKTAVEADMAEATLLGVGGTPSIYVNGRRAPNYNIETLKPIVDEMLAEPAGK